MADLPADQIAMLKKAFDAFDHEKKGCISTDMVGTILDLLGVQLVKVSLPDIIAEVDEDGSGELEFEEFVTLAARFLGEDEEEDAEAMQKELREAFRLYDKEGNGYITTDVLREILAELDDKITSSDLDSMIEEIDSDGSGTVDFDGRSRPGERAGVVLLGAMKNLRSNVNLEKLLKLYDEGDWRKILSLVDEGGEEETEEDCFFSWIRPTEENLRFVSREVGDSQVVSVGCGSGLLEWLVHAATGINVIGLEMDRGWWEQPHGPPKFLPLHFFEETSISDLCDARPITLLFCYFNNAAAFDDYMRNFEGSRVIIIGPGEGRGTHTAPAPFAHTLTQEWTLKTFQELGGTKDFIAVYTR